MKNLMNTLATLMTLLAIGPGCDFDPCANGARTESITLSKDQWAGMLDTAFSGLSIRLNNYTAEAHAFSEDPAYAFYHPNDSSVHSDALSLDLQFDIPVQRAEPYSLYINDLRSIGVMTETRSRSAAVSIFFEGEDLEVIGNCVDNLACVCGEPKVDLDDMVLEVLISFGAEGGELVIDDMRAEMRSTFEESGPCVDNVCAFACDLFVPDRESEARRAVEEQVLHFLEGKRRVLEQIFRAHLEGLGVTGEVIYAEVDPHGENLFLVVKNEDPTCM